ncbi:hypothetical protein ACLKA6_003510 [Drosophila palustris]
MAKKKDGRKTFGFFSTNDGKRTSEDTNAIRDGAAAALLFIVMGVLPVPPQDPLPPSLSAQRTGYTRLRTRLRLRKCRNEMRRGRKEEQAK